MRCRKMLLALFFFIELIWLRSVNSIVVTTKSGPVRGKLVEDYGLSYFSFTGIPYAESTAGYRRFKPPVPKKPWNEVFDATKPGSVCPQIEYKYKKSEMNEDCLILNIYAPTNNTGMAVLVFIHGGGIDKISGNPDVIYGPEFLMQRGIILVTMNYRLGTLGFLSLDTEAAPGNAGLKDILLSLKWVKENIDVFGGDPDNVTIGGHSTGAYLAHCMLLTEKSTGLFNKALLISGSALSYKFFTRYPKARAMRLAEYLGLPTNDTDNLVNELTKIDEHEIVRAQDVLKKLSPKHYLIRFPFLICKEKYSRDAIITRDPLEIMKSGMPQNVPVLTGFNTEEGLYIMYGLNKEPITFDILQNKLDLIIPRDIEYPRYSQMRRNLIHSIKELYFQRESQDDIIIDLLSDSQYNYDIDYWIKIHKQRLLSNKVYYYLMSLDCEVNYGKLKYNFSHPGMAHSDELGYMFLGSLTRPFYKNLSERCKNMIDIFLTYFVNFIKYSDPTPAFLNMTPKWEDCGKERKHFFISEQCEFRPYAPFNKRLQFWSDVYDEYYRYVQEGRPLEIFTL